MSWFWMLIMFLVGSQLGLLAIWLPGFITGWTAFLPAICIGVLLVGSGIATLAVMAIRKM